MKGAIKEKFGCLWFYLVLLLLFTSPVTTPILIEKFSSADYLTRKYIIEKYKGLNRYDVITESVLTEYIHESSKNEERIGAVCNDGWISFSTGSGTCSHHGGVSYWKYKTTYTKSYDRCKKEAMELIKRCMDKAHDVSWVE